MADGAGTIKNSLKVKIEKNVKAILSLKESAKSSLDYHSVLNFLKENYKLKAIKENALKVFVDEYNQSDKVPAEIVIAQGKAPKNGIDAFMIWKNENLQEADNKEHIMARRLGRVHYELNDGEQEQEQENEEVLYDEEGNIIRQPGVDLEQVNFYEMNSRFNVLKGDLIGTYYPPTEGLAGLDVQGKPISVRTGKNLKVKAGRNVVVSADKREWRSEIDGRVIYDGKRVGVEEVLLINKNVDFSIGNIDFTGTVRVGGNIPDLFIVKSRLDLDVDGLIAGATIECGGELNVNGGIAQRGKGSILSHGNITAKFINNANVRCHGDITVAKEALNNDIVGARNIICDHGKIAGGTIMVARDVFVKILGSEQGTKTVIGVGRDIFEEEKIPGIEKKIRATHKKVEEINAKISPFIPMMKRLEHKRREALTELMYKVSEMEMEIADLQKRIDDFNLRDFTVNSITVYGTLHEGVTVSIGPIVHRFDESRTGPIRIRADKATSSIVVVPAGS